MFSVIVCSISPAKFTAVEAMYKASFGEEPWEMIGIHDALSLAEGYNRGIDRSRGDLVVFSHDDVEVLSPQLPERLKAYLTTFDLIGVAGTDKLTNALWIAAGPPHIFGQIAHTRPDGLIEIARYGTPHSAAGIQAMDGVFLAARRSLVAQLRFDAETFDGFHLYDVDFTHTAFLKGYKLGVVPGVHLLHQSIGTLNASWPRLAARFQLKRFDGKPGDFDRAAVRWLTKTVRSRQEAELAMCSL